MAYGTFGAIPSSQALPLAKTFYLNTTLSTTVANGVTNSSVGLGTITMPFNGDAVFNGSIRLGTTSSPGIQDVRVQISSTSTPAPTWAAEGYHWQEMVNSTWNVHVPLVAQWENVGSGTIIVINIQVICGTGGSGLSLTKASGIAIATMT